MASEKRFVGSTHKIKEDFYSIGFTRAHLEELLAELDSTGSEWVNINLGSNNFPDKPADKKVSYFCWISTWKKDGAADGGNVVTSNQTVEADIDDEEIPF